MRTWKIIRKLLKVVAWLCAILVGLHIIIISFYSFRGKIYSRILTAVNESRPGELLVDNIHIAPFGFHPFLAIRLDSVSFYENKKEFRNAKSIPVLE